MLSCGEGVKGSLTARGLRGGRDPRDRRTSDGADADVLSGGSESLSSRAPGPSLWRVVAAMLACARGTAVLPQVRTAGVCRSRPPIRQSIVDVRRGTSADGRRPRTCRGAAHYAVPPPMNPVCHTCAA